MRRERQLKDCRQTTGKINTVNIITITLLLVLAGDNECVGEFDVKWVLQVLTYREMIVEVAACWPNRTCFPVVCIVGVEF